MKPAKELLQGLREAFNTIVAPAAPAAPVAPAQAAAPATPAEPAAPAAKTYKLQDGTEIAITQAGETPAIGDTVTVNGAPAAEGVLTLEDGSSITVDAAGTITAITPAEPVTNDLSNAPAPAAAPAPAVIAPVAPQFDAEGKFAEQNATIEQINAELKDIKEKFAAQEQTLAKYEQTIQGLFDVCEQLTAVPSADPATLTGVQKDRFEKTNKKEERLNRFAEALRERKKEHNK